MFVQIRDLGADFGADEASAWHGEMRLVSQFRATFRNVGQILREKSSPENGTEHHVLPRERRDHRFLEAPLSEARGRAALRARAQPLRGAPLVDLQNK